MATSDMAPAGVVLPIGVSVVGAKETTQPNLAGQLTQGMSFTFQLPTGATTTLFVPYSLLTDTAWVTQQVASRVQAIQAVTGGSSRS